MRQDVHQERISSLSSSLVTLSSRDKTYSIVRLVYFLLAIGIAVFLSTLSWVYTVPWVILSLILFSRLLRYHESIRKERKLTEIQIELNKHELRSMDNDHSGFPHGESYQDALHPYSTDMDIFGDHSIFQMINRANTIFGKNRLAEVLSHALPKDDIPTYQEASQELETNIDWRQKLYALGKLDIDKDHNYEGLKRWLFIENPLKINMLIVILSIVICWVLFGVLLYAGIPFLLALLAFIPNAILAYRNNQAIATIHSLLEKNEKFIKPYAEIVAFLEESSFQSDLLYQLSARITSENGKASTQLYQLAAHLKQLDMRTNFFGVLFTYGFLWDHIYALKVEAWKDKNRSILFTWLETIGEFEYISSLANYAYQRPDACYPLITTTAIYEGKDLGHPLLHHNDRVCNDLSMKTQKHIKIVTGSNMGGKSTFLRTVGINIILSYTGSKVCASRLHLPYLKLMSSMRTQDALKENTSSFYAELKRLKMVLDQVNERDDVFFLLDEILKGTNSNDRHNGAKAMIKQMIKHDGAGLISTHDLELGLIEEDMPEAIDNICFEVAVQGEELVFDYKIKNGISKSFNATHLMRNIGIDI